MCFSLFEEHGKDVDVHTLVLLTKEKQTSRGVYQRCIPRICSNTPRRSPMTAEVMAWASAPVAASADCSTDSGCCCTPPPCCACDCCLSSWTATSTAVLQSPQPTGRRNSFAYATSETHSWHHDSNCLPMKQSRAAPSSQKFGLNTIFGIAVVLVTSNCWRWNRSDPVEMTTRRNGIETMSVGVCKLPVVG